MIWFLFPWFYHRNCSKPEVKIRKPILDAKGRCLYRDKIVFDPLIGVLNLGMFPTNPDGSFKEKDK